MATSEKHFLYVGYYYDVEGNYILKIGTTNDLERRQQEHNRNYKKSPKNPMIQDESFHYIWYKSLSKYNTLRYEDSTREAWKELPNCKHLPKDRFILYGIPETVNVKIRKNYEIPLPV